MRLQGAPVALHVHPGPSKQGLGPSLIVIWFQTLTCCKGMKMSPLVQASQRMMLAEWRSGGLPGGIATFELAHACCA